MYTGVHTMILSLAVSLARRVKVETTKLHQYRVFLDSTKQV